jgi:hypothetical protein
MTSCGSSYRPRFRASFGAQSAQFVCGRYLRRNLDWEKDRGLALPLSLRMRSVWQLRIAESGERAMGNRINTKCGGSQ